MPDYIYIINGGLFETKVFIIGSTNDLITKISSYLPYYGNNFSCSYSESTNVNGDMVALKNILAQKHAYKYGDIYRYPISDVKSFIKQITGNKMQKLDLTSLPNYNLLL